VAIKAPAFSPDDQEYYPLHEEDDVPETPPHREVVTYVYDALRVRFPNWFITSNVCIYWERGNTRDYRAPDLFVVKEPLTEPVTRVYQLWKQPPVAFVLEIGSRSTFRKDVGPKVEVYQERVKAAEYLHVDLDHGAKQLWRMGRTGYEPIAAEANGRLRSQELGLEFDLVDGVLRIFTQDGEMLLTHEEEARLRQKEARLRQEAEERAADLERQLAELRAQRPE
jgi:Uma2 family endonuclease